MSRNYKKEREWQLTKYDQIRAYIDIDLGVALRKKLKENKKTIASWITENAEKYLNEEYNKNNYYFFLKVLTILCIVLYNIFKLRERGNKNEK